MSVILGAIQSVALLSLGAAIQSKLIQINPVIGMASMALGGLCVLGTIIEAMEERKPVPQPARLLPKNRKLKH